MNNIAEWNVWVAVDVRRPEKCASPKMRKSPSGHKYLILHANTTLSNTLFFSFVYFGSVVDVVVLSIRKKFVEI